MNKAQAIGIQIQLEGGEANLKGDPGGHTKFGITQATLDHLNTGTNWVGVKLPSNVSSLTEDMAYAIYDKIDWQQIRGDDLPGALAALVLNCAVNMGEPEAVVLLHECLKLQGGIIGAETIAAVKSWRSSYMPGQTLAEEFAAHVGVKYASLYAREGQFELGWLRRLFRVYTLAVST
jgi:lysozyme family protein